MPTQRLAPTDGRGNVQREPAFFLAGTWDDWSSFEELRSGQGAVRTALVKVRTAPGVEEFQVVQDRNWGKRFHPPRVGRGIEGPDSRHGVNWRAEVPLGCERLEVSWDPRGKRSISWRFVNPTGTWAERVEDKRLTKTLPFFLVGSWDNWSQFYELAPRNGKDLTHSTRIRPQHDLIELQVSQGRDWDLRFHPGAGGEPLGPCRPPHGSNWKVEIPSECSWLSVTWDPRGPRLQWQLLREDGSDCCAALPAKDSSELAVPVEQVQLWEVVGGEGLGGVLVREGPGLSSSKAPTRLATGALLRGMEVLDGRLRFQRLTGEGPDEGWVSVALGEKQLVRRLDVDSVEQAREWQLSQVSQRLGAGTRHLRGALCAEDDLGLFGALWAELDGSGRWRPPGGMAFVDSRYKTEIEPELAASAFVLRTLMETLDVELEMWWANLYEDGSSGCDWHRDGHARHSVNVTVSASFGAGRDFSLLHPATGAEFAFPIRNGDIIAFNDGVDESFLHRVYPTTESVGPRISVILMGRTSIWAQEVDRGCLQQRCEERLMRGHEIVSMASEEIDKQEQGLRQEQKRLRQVQAQYEALLRQQQQDQGTSLTSDLRALGSLYSKMQSAKLQHDTLEKRCEAIEEMRREAALRANAAHGEPEENELFAF